MCLFCINLQAPHVDVKSDNPIHQCKTAKSVAHPLTCIDHCHLLKSWIIISQKAESQDFFFFFFCCASFSFQKSVVLALVCLFASIPQWKPTGSANVWVKKKLARVSVFPCFYVLSHAQVQCYPQFWWLHSDLGHFTDGMGHASTHHHTHKYSATHHSGGCTLTWGISLMGSVKSSRLCYLGWK